MAEAVIPHRLRPSSQPRTNRILMQPQRVGVNKMAFTNGQLWRVRAIFIGIVVLFCILVTRLYSIQVDRHKNYLRKAVDQQWARVFEKSKRATISDRHGQILSQSRMVKSVYVDTVKVKDPEALSWTMAELLNVSAERIYDRLTSKRGRFVVIKRKITDFERMAVEELGEESVYFEDEPKRIYPQGTTAGQIVGFVDIDDRGISGLEYGCDEILKGELGWKIMRRDGRGKLCALDKYHYPARDGYKVETTIDSIAQKRLEKHLQDACEKWSPKWGAGIVTDALTGEILAMANWPAYDPNDIASSNGDARRLRVVTDGLPPGSTWKPFTYASALENGIITPETTYNCHYGSFRHRARTIKDTGRYGILSAELGIVKSSNICMAQIGLDMGDRLMRQTVLDFGFAQKTGIEFPGEYPGYITPENRWSYFSTTSVSFGQEMRVSVLQMAMAYSSIANGGLLMKPMLIKKIFNNEGKVLREYRPTIVRRVISEKTATLVRRALRNVVLNGTAKKSNIREYAVAGKTGTAQMENHAGGPDHSRYAGWFAGYAPADNPRICVIVVLVEPKGKYYGGTVAAPVVTSVIKDVLPLMKVAPKTGIAASVD